MKVLIEFIIVFFSLSMFSQNRYSQISTSTYTPLTQGEIMYVPSNNQNIYNQNRKYLYALKNWILELKPQIQEANFLSRLMDEYNDLIRIEDLDLSKYSKYLYQTETAIREIVSDYNIWVNNQNSLQNNEIVGLNYLKKALQEFEIKNYSSSIRYFSKYLENDSNNTDVIFYRALAKSEINDLEGAINDYNYILDIYSNYPMQNNKLSTVYNNKAYCFVKMKQPQKALPLVEIALDMEKEDWFIWDTRGEIYYLLNEFNKAIEDFNKSLELKENANSYLLRGLCYINLGHNQKGCFDLNNSYELESTKAIKEISKYCNND